MSNYRLQPMSVCSNAPNSVKGLFIKPSLVAYMNLRFVLFDAPSDSNIHLYASELKSQNVVAVVRLCEPTYDKAHLEGTGITVYDWPFMDGEPPPNPVVKSWLYLIEEVFGNINGNHVRAKGKLKDSMKDGDRCLADEGMEESNGPLILPAIGVHCVAGLGRAPVLVAIALIEAGMSPLDSVIHVRECRRGAINARQLKCIEGYKRHTSRHKRCSIM